MPNLTPRQQAVLRFIQDYLVEHEYPPTMQEIADHLGVSRPTDFEHIEALEKKKVLRRDPTLARNVTLTRDYQPYDGSLPLVGRIAAGAPIEAIADSEVLDLESLFRGRPGETFVLQVRGNSMIDEQIRDGDYVIVEKRAEARNGETVVAILPDGDATLKKFYKEPGRIRLQPANETMQPIYAPNVTIQGVVIGVLRKY